MQASSEDFSQVLFTVTPNDKRSVYTLRVTTPYLCGLVMQEIANLDATEQVSFYHRASDLPQFQGTWGYMFEKYFLVWLYSAERADALPCSTAKNTTSAKSSYIKKVTRSTFTADDQAKHRPQPLRRERLTVINGDSDFANAKDSDTLFGWLPASRVFPPFDAVICTDKTIITIQLTVSSKHFMKRTGFDRLKQYLPEVFESARTWCHVFFTDCSENATSLRRQHHDVDFERNISIYSAVLDVSKCKFSSKDVERTFTPSVCRCKPLYIDLGTYLGVIRTSLLRWTPVGWR
jgi:hypothetical protein